jgi:exosome complex protein LRP1
LGNEKRKKKMAKNKVCAKTKATTILTV